MTPAKRKKRSLRKEVTYPHSIEKVWVALTDPRALAEWLMPNDFRPEVGHRFVLQVDGAPRMNFSGLNECEVLACDPPNRMVWSWVVVPGKAGRERPEAMTLTWSLSPVGEGTRLVLEQDGLEHLRFFDRMSMAFGWGTMLKRWLPRIMARIGGDLDFSPGAIPLKKRCYGTKTIPDHLVR
ncbi:MAG: ATPase [Planctomycetes bacterium]|nr:ATPase [Planctomycetota bacterium]